MRELDGGKMDGDLPFMTKINFTIKRFKNTIQDGIKKDSIKVFMSIFFNILKMNLKSLINIENSIEKNIPSVSNLDLITKGNNKLEPIIKI